MVDSRTGQKIHKRSLQNFVVPEYKKVFTNKETKTKLQKSQNDRMMGTNIPKRDWNQLEELSVTETGTM